MSLPMREGQPTEGGATPPGKLGGGRSGVLATEEGRTSIADSVVAKVVGVAVREVPGVHEMGAGISRALGAVRERLPGSATSVTQGVAVEVGERQTAIDLDLVVEYGVSIPDLATGVRRNVVNAVEKICGLEVTEVNISIGDVHLAGDDGEQQPESRVQ
jgi:uncharacterized alkaline shock family protein YloU